MPDGGELRAFFKGAQEDAAQAVESAAGKMAGFGDETAQNVRDSLNTLSKAEDANTEAINGIRGEPGNLPETGSGAGPGGPNPIEQKLNGQESGSTPQDPRLTPGTQEYDKYINDLAKDPAKNGKVSPGSVREATVAAQAEADGDIPGPVTRTPFKDGKDDGDFTDGTGQKWEVKSSPDVRPSYRPGAGRPISNPQTDADFTNMVNKELGKGLKVLLDPDGMTPTRLAQLQELAASHSEWEGKVTWGR